MQNLYIEATNATPRIVFDHKSGNLLISGRSMPENCDDFYEPIIAWAKEYITNPQPKTEIIFNFEYYNSTSLRSVLELMNIIKQIKEPNTIKIIWYYEKGDDLSSENCDDLQYALGFPIEQRVIE